MSADAEDPDFFDDEEEIDYDEIIKKEHADITYEEFDKVRQRLLDEGYSPFAILIGLNRAGWEAGEALNDELHK